MTLFFALSRLALLSLACITLGAQAQAPAGPDAKAPQELRKFINVDAATTTIEEKSVSLLSALQANQNLGLTRREGVGGAIPDMQAEMPNGATYYVFQLKGKESLKVNVKCEVSGMVWLQFVKPTVQDAMASSFRRANMAPKNLRSKKIEITNVFDKPYEVVLVVYGTTNYPYTLTIERKS